MRLLGRFMKGLLWSLLCLFSTWAASAEPGATSREFDLGYARLHAVVWEPGVADAETVLALPGSGGDVTRYNSLGPLLAAAGYRLIALNQRGIMGSTGELDNLTLHDYAADVAAVIDLLGVGKVHVLGWALGNRIMRVVATDFPDKVASVSLIAAGGLAEPLTAPGELAALLGDAELSESEKAQLARRTLFSPHSDEELVLEYVRGLRYWNAARASQTRANRDTPVAQWWAGGEGPMLIVQGLDDKTAPPENGNRMKAEFGDRVTLVNLEHAGHLMGMEQPRATADAIIGFLRQHPI
jgi:pimeloyl-ACP methyl ester carboxylesterase